MADFDNLSPEELEAKLGAMAREVEQADRQLESPPADLWARIESASQAGSEDASPEAHGADRSAPNIPPPTNDSANVSHLSKRRRRWVAPASVAAAIALLVGGNLVYAQANNTTPNDIVAMAEIVNDGLPVANDMAGSADLIDDDGRYFLDVDVPELPEADGFYELWIIDTEVSGMHSLGPVSGDGWYELPAGVEPADFPVVDVSVEPGDGVPTHSGQSIWRGQLEF